MLEVRFWMAQPAQSTDTNPNEDSLSLALSYSLQSSNIL